MSCYTLPMATTREYMEYIVDTLGRGLGHESFSMKKMFGEYALYYHGTVVGLVCDGTLFIKITPETTRLLGDIETGFPYPGAKPWYIIDETAMEDAELMEQLIETIYTERIASDTPKKQVKK